MNPEQPTEINRATVLSFMGYLFDFYCHNPHLLDEVVYDPVTKARETFVATDPTRCLKVVLDLLVEQSALDIKCRDESWDEFEAGLLLGICGRHDLAGFERLAIPLLQRNIVRATIIDAIGRICGGVGNQPSAPQCFEWLKAAVENVADFDADETIRLIDNIGDTGRYSGQAEQLPALLATIEALGPKTQAVVEELAKFRKA